MTTTFTTQTQVSSCRIVLFTDADVFAGTERHMLDLALGLREQGAQVQIACPRPAILADKAEATGIKVTCIQKGGMLDRPAIATLTRLLTRGEVDIVHAHNGRTRLSAALAVQKAKRGACVATQHFLTPNHTTQRGPAAIVSGMAHRWMNRHTMHFIAISEAVRNNMLARQEANPAKISVVPNGLMAPDVRTLTPPNVLRSELNMPMNAPLIVCAARLEPEKDVETLIAAMALVVAAHPDAHCIIAGTGSQEQYLHKKIEQLHLLKRVRLLGYRSDALSLIYAGDLFVLPSLAEPFGLVLLEAMALGKPIVATAVGGPIEIVTPGCTGLLVPPSHPQELACALLTLLGDAEARRKMGQSGYQRFQQCFTARQMAQATLKVYQQALAENSSS